MSLRPYQVAYIDEVRAAVRAGHRRILGVMPTGAGKTRTHAEILRLAVANGKRALWLAHRAELVDQGFDALTAAGLSCGTISASASSAPQPFAPVQVATVQTLVARSLRPPADIIVADECVTGDTVVGGKRADEVRVGDRVVSWDGSRCVERRVTHVFVNPAQSSLFSLHANGRVLNVTGNHPIWVHGKGYVNASNVSVGDLLLVQTQTNQEVRARKSNEVLLEGLRKAGAAGEEGASSFLCDVQRSCAMVEREGMAANLFARVPQQAARDLHGLHQSPSCFGSDEAKQSDASACVGEEDGAVNERSHFSFEGRQRETHAATGKTRSGAESPNGACDTDARGDRDVPVASHQLQGGHRGSVGDACDRSGWPVAQLEEVEVPGLPQNQGSQFARVDRVEVHKPGGDGTFGGLCPGGLVYNFEVESEHNFFADGILTHNCHHYVSDTWRPLLADYPNAIVLGPTATPQRSDGRGLGELFTHLVVGARIADLTAAGHLVPAEIIAPAHKLRVGEIAQRPVDAYHAHAPGQRAICFSPSVAASEKHAEEFRALGYTAATISGTTPWGERKQALADLARGRIQVLCNVYVATEGFDVPEIECVILARGFGSCGPYLQSVGRALRPAAGKALATILDLTGTSHVHGHPSEERVYSLEGRGIRRKDATVSQSYCRVCGCPIEAGADCPECGTEAAKAKGQRVTGEALVKFAGKRAEGTDKRIETLRRWLGEAHAKGHKPGAAYHRYKAVYNEWPPHSVKAAAMVAA